MDPSMTGTEGIPVARTAITGDANNRDATANYTARQDTIASNAAERNAADADNQDTNTGNAVGLDAAAGAAKRARAFIHAIVWAEHTTLWDLLSAHGQSTALTVAVRNGLDRVVASRIRDGLADPVEQDRFLQQLVGGLRRDLRSVELTELTVGDCRTIDENTVTVELLSPSRLPGTGAWPAGQVVLSFEASRGWAVDRLNPRLAGP